MVVKDDQLVLEENKTKFKTLEELSESTALKGKKQNFQVFYLEKKNIKSKEMVNCLLKICQNSQDSSLKKNSLKFHLIQI